MKQDKLSVLERSELVLETFPPGEALSLTEVSARTGLPRSTTHRLLVDLASIGWIERSGRKYRLGLRLFELGERVGVKHRLRTAALPYMQDLYAVTHRTINLAVRDGDDAVYLEKIYGHSVVALPSQVGGRLPLTCTAVGKALLGSESAQVRSEVLARRLRRRTPNSLTDSKALSLELNSTRRTGIAIEREEASIGGCCLAAPVLVGGRPVAAISVSVPVQSFRPQLIAPAVRTATLALGRVLTPHSDLYADRGSDRVAAYG